MVRDPGGLPSPKDHEFVQNQRTPESGRVHESVNTPYCHTHHRPTGHPFRVRSVRRPDGSLRTEMGIRGPRTTPNWHLLTGSVTSGSYCLVTIIFRQDLHAWSPILKKCTPSVLLKCLLTLSVSLRPLLTRYLLGPNWYKVPLSYLTLLHFIFIFVLVNSSSLFRQRLWGSQLRP